MEDNTGLIICSGTQTFDLSPEIMYLQEIIDKKSIFPRNRVFETPLNLLTFSLESCKVDKFCQFILIDWFSCYKDAYVLWEDSFSIFGDKSIIIYAPTSEGKIDDEDLKKIEQNPNMIISDSFGRLLNDLIFLLFLKNNNSLHKNVEEKLAISK